MTHNDWHSITNNDSQPLAQYNPPLFTSIAQHSSKPLTQYSTPWLTTAIRIQWMWIMECYTEPVVVYHGVYCWASDCESWWVLLFQWLLIMVCYTESVVLNYAVLCLWTMVGYTEPVAVNHCLLCCASRCESWWVILCQGCELWCVMLSLWL
jgi:hypothetical protein